MKSLSVPAGGTCQQLAFLLKFNASKRPGPAAAAVFHGLMQMMDSIN
jgi:hypothetical protein